MTHDKLGASVVQLDLSRLNRNGFPRPNRNKLKNIIAIGTQ